MIGAASRFALPAVALLGVGTLGFVIGSLPADAGAQPERNQKRQGHQSGADMMAMMQRWEEHRAISEHHEELHDTAGVWLVESTHWMDPAAPPERSQMIAQITPIMGGLFMHETITGVIDMGTPAAWAGTSITGYDNAKGRHVFVWFDSMNSSITLGYGDATGPDSYAFEYEMYDPMTGEMRPMRNTVERVSDDEMVFEMYTKKDAGADWFRTLKLEYARQE